MKTSLRNIFSAVAVLLAAACSKDFKDNTPQMATIQIHATLEPVTRSAAEAIYAESDGIKASWESSDVLYVFTSDGTCSEFNVSSMDSDGSATFTGSIQVAEGSRITAMLKNSAVQAASYDASTKKVTIDLSSQKGSLEDACDRDVLFASGSYEGGDDPLDLSFSHLNSVAKFILKLPGKASEYGISFLRLTSGTSESKTNVNRMTVDVTSGTAEYLNGGAESADGDIFISSVTTSDADSSITAYASICPAALQNSTIEGTSSTDPTLHSLWRVAGSQALTPAAGSTYSITRKNCQQMRIGTIWMTDADTTINGNALAENRTGSPKITSLSTTIWGQEYDLKVMQVNERDFAGQYALSGDVRMVDRSPSVEAATTAVSGTYGSVGGKTVGYYYDGNWAHPSNNSGASTALTLTYNASSENNLTVDGLYEGMTMPAKVTLCRSLQKVSLALKIENKATLMSSGTYEGEYMAYQTELIQNNSSATYYELGFGNGGAFDYQGTVSLADDEVKVNFAQRQTCTAYPSYLVIGILLDRYSSAGGGSTAGTYLIRSTEDPYYKSGPNLSGAAYAWVVQGDFSITKAISSTSSDGINAIGYTPIN